VATVKKANVPPTHPTVWVGLGLAVVGLLLAMYAYTGARVYDIAFAFIAIAGASIALVGILAAAWGRSIMSARAARARRATFSQDALAIAKPVEASEAMAETMGSETMPTVAAPSSKKRFSFSVPKRMKKEEPRADPAALFAFKRRPAAPPPAGEELVTLVEKPVKATLKCPQCSGTFSVEGVRPFEARCPACGFASTV
jgi:hypothetical protein